VNSLLVFVNVIVIVTHVLVSYPGEALVAVLASKKRPEHEKCAVLDKCGEAEQEKRADQTQYYDEEIPVFIKVSDPRGQKPLVSAKQSFGYRI
jgi:hypothetical protein